MRLTFALASARAFRMTLTDENGGCTFSTGAQCGGALAQAPSTGLVSGEVLTYTLPSKVFMGRVLITEPDGTTASDVLQWYCSSGAGTCGTLTDSNNIVHEASDRLIFYSLDRFGALADVGLLPSWIRQRRTRTAISHGLFLAEQIPISASRLVPAPSPVLAFPA